ncbi:hypothetical protein VB734_01710 [Synechococcus sp. BA-124 BA4]|jgi:hypothetical protein|uniref:hypothetical protein n=1 Tax=unclassified Synechococcus TaxID=2626047 RepID=UPI0018CCFC8A|nr:MULTISPECIES: hypothetical protein [unclassified Synechococcus]MEA5398758.1 hypothetical protein [Synechococcus sp. BA-124 BA4]QPN57100.1 hypothetical protein I1E95_02760 [Synechococcus sp. CBW1107]
MNHVLWLLLGAALASPASAALPPQDQNAKDLDVIVAFVKQHPKVMASLNTIDLSRRTVTFGDNCIATFAREQKTVPPGFVSPAASLVFSSSTCPIN